MSLDFSKLENMKHQNGVTTARCPACAEEGRDRKGNHLFINNDGRFSCVCSPGKDGHSHRSRIFELVGVKEHSGPINIKIKEVKRAKAPEVIESNILGRLGRVKSSQDKIGNLKEVKVAAKSANCSRLERRTHIFISICRREIELHGHISCYIVCP